MRLAERRHVTLLHRLKQRRLRERSRTVDLVSEEDIREDRPLPKDVATAAQVAAARDLGGLRVDRHLHATEVTPDQACDGAREKRLRAAGRPQEHVTAREHTDQHRLDRGVVPDHCLPYLELCRAEYVVHLPSSPNRSNYPLREPCPARSTADPAPRRPAWTTPTAA